MVAHVLAELDWTIRRSSRARRIRVIVEPDGAVVVVLPLRAHEREAGAAVLELRGWIDRRRAEALARRRRMAREPGTLPYLGQTLRLLESSSRTRVHRQGDVLRVPPAGPAQDAALERWLRRAAREEVSARLDVAVSALGREWTSLTIRGQRTRWGSCTSNGAMSINWRLMLAPEAVLDYVVWHEACHLVHLDHSPAFWGLVERHRPGYREPQRWLRDNGSALVL